jgi:predicted anti-sigma-YlaC factor YlaD
MHRVIRDHLEEILAESHAPEGEALAGKCDAPVQVHQLHLQECEECRVEIAAMREQAGALRQLRTDAEPSVGFYARVMERIDAQRAGSIWNVFSESPFGRRIALASVALALLAGIYLVTSEQLVEQANVPEQMISATLPDEGLPATNVRMVVGDSAVPNRDAVLVNLVTYREQ